MTDISTNLRSGKQRVLITGGTGLVGSRLSRLLKESQYEVTHLSRNPTKGEFETFHWDIKKKEIDKEAIKGADVIIHLAGAGVADRRWSKSWKKEILESRTESTKLLFEAVKNHNSRLSQFISASAVGYYGWNTGADLVSEADVRGEGFLADVTDQWEKKISQFDDIGVPNATVRVGVVLSESGGALDKMAKPIRLGAGAALATGKQYLSWIHIDDLCGIFNHLVENNITGVFNGVAPEPATNLDFTKMLAKTLKKPLFLPKVPAFMLRLMLGEMADMLIGGNRVSSKKIEESGFNFQYPSLHSALKKILV